MNEDIRWKQRLENYRKAMSHLKQAVMIEDADIITQAATIQFFEVAFELAWKVMKDYLEAEGFEEVKSPRGAIKKAFEVELISDAHTWLEALQKRNLTAHTYDEKSAAEIYNLICSLYFPLLEVFEKRMEQIDAKT